MTMKSKDRVMAWKGKTGRGVTAVVAVGALLALTACGGQSTPGDSADGGTAGGQAAEIAKEAQERIEALYSGETFAPPPTEGPAAVQGARVAMVNTGTQAATGSAVAENAREVAEIMNWDLSVFDGEFDPNKQQEGIRQAIASQADIIWLFAIDCPVVLNALQEAKAAGIPVISQESYDCDYFEPSDPSMFTHTLGYVEGGPGDWSRALGAAQADWLIAKTDGNARVIEFAVTDIVTSRSVYEGFIERMEECSTCEILQVVENSASVGPETQEKIEQALLRNPDANALAVAYDDLMTGGGAAAVMASGRSDDLFVAAGAGYESNIEIIRNDQGQDGGYAVDMGYETWSAADLINRVLAGAEIAPSGVSLGFIDRDHLPESGDWVVPFDYRSAFTEVWAG